MKTLIARIEFYFEINKNQAEFIANKYFKKDFNFDNFTTFYEHTIINEKIIGTSFEKLKQVCEIALIEFKLRFENKRIFEEWLFKKYKNKAFFRLLKNTIAYEYNAYDNFGKAYPQKFTNENECIISINKYGNLCYNDFEFENGAFKELTLNYIFSNQNLISTELFLQNIKLKKHIPLNFELEYNNIKTKQKQVYEENKEKFKGNLNEFRTEKK